ncbi:hypothetical protein MKX01_037886 [Papaver californicum]|nr:hypothetical protein MKX01_037886 [Papaver californicum]
MESEKKVSVSSNGDVKVIEWEDFEQELARLWSLSSALKISEEKKDLLQQKLESLMQVRAEQLNRSNELEVIKQKLEAKRLVMGNSLTRSNVHLIVSVKSLSVAGKALSLSSNQLQLFSINEAYRLLSGERGHVRLKKLQKMLQMRQQYMVVASLIASYLEVPLRYPLRFGGSHSYIHDYAPSVELLTSTTTSSSALLSNLKPTEFPLFLEGQDTTRAAYAIFLLNKDLEQILNFIGFESLGPRHILANLMELLRTIQSQ